MINSNLFTIIDSEGYATKDEAYSMEKLYLEKPGVTVVQDKNDGLWYIVQSKDIAKLVTN